MDDFIISIYVPTWSQKAPIIQGWFFNIHILGVVVFFLFLNLCTTAAIVFLVLGWLNSLRSTEFKSSRENKSSHLTGSSQLNIVWCHHIPASCLSVNAAKPHI